MAEQILSISFERLFHTGVCELVWPSGKKTSKSCDLWTLSCDFPLTITKTWGFYSYRMHPSINNTFTHWFSLFAWLYLQHIHRTRGYWIMASTLLSNRDCQRRHVMAKAHMEQLGSPDHQVMGKRWQSGPGKAPGTWKWTWFGRQRNAP